MSSVTCPVCGKGFRIGSEEAGLYEQVTCPSCDATLEVIDEDPVVLEEVEF